MHSVSVSRLMLPIVFLPRAANSGSFANAAAVSAHAEHAHGCLCKNLPIIYADPTITPTHVSLDLANE